MFIRAAKGRFTHSCSFLVLNLALDITKTDRIAASANYTTNELISATELRNPDTQSAFYVTIHATSSDTTKDSFQLKVSTSAGSLTIPSAGNITLNGRDSKIIVVSPILLLPGTSLKPV